MRIGFLIGIIICLITSCKVEKEQSGKEAHISNPIITIDTVQGTSLLGKPLINPQVDSKRDSVRINNLQQAQEDFKVDSSAVDPIIWLGRRWAYLGDYKKAIDIFSEGIKLHPNEPRLYRHRGHRYISIRQLDKAISDLEKAADLIKDQEDIVEQDGIPNRLNTPVSSLHTNIYYHLGLAYYLKGYLEQAEQEFKHCLEASKNDDMQVASRHWLYMILKMQDKDEEAAELLEPVTEDMNIIENDAYHQLLLFYKGLKTEQELIGSDSAGSSEAVKYGIANWYFYNDQLKEATRRFKQLVDTGNWAGFGSIAAEAQLARAHHD